MPSAPLAPQGLLALVQASLPPLGIDLQPQLKSPHDAAALFVHACMLSIGFRLIGLSEDDRLESAIDESDPKPLPASWNATPGSYGFRYAHSQSSLHFLIKVNRLGNKTHVMGVGLGDDKTASFDFITQDYTSDSFFPYTNATSEPGKLKDAFISENRIRDLATLVKINIIQKLVPGVTKSGYEEEAIRSEAGPGDNAGARARQPEEDPLRIPRLYDGPRFPRPYAPPIPAGGDGPPGFDDEYDILRPPTRITPGGRNPLSIGDDDLNPPGLGPYGPGPMNPMGGMHPTADHPMFGGHGGSGYGDLRAPPGARYDPIGPGDAPRGGLRGPRGPSSGPPGAPFNPFSGFSGDDFI